MGRRTAGSRTRVIVAYIAVAAALLACGRVVEPGTTSAPSARGSAPPGCEAGRHSSAITFSAGDGTCLPIERAVAYHCDDTVPPVVALNAGGAEVHRFLGGRYAVVVQALPAKAAPIGSGGGIELFQEPGRPSWLYVVQDGTATRWLPLRTGTREPDTGPAAAFIGDSITLGAEVALLEALPGWTVTIDAEIGRGSTSGVAIAPTMVATGPDVVVVELGTNDVDAESFRDHAESILATFRDLPLVVWQTVHSPDEEIVQVNEAIRTVTPRWPNTAIADWDTFVPDDALSFDGIHPTPEGTAKVAELVGPFLRGWSAAVAGGGATSCALQAEAPA